MTCEECGALNHLNADTCKRCHAPLVMEPEARACRSLAAKNLARAIWQGYKSSVPPVLEVVAGVARWAAYSLATLPERQRLDRRRLRRAMRPYWS